MPGQLVQTFHVWYTGPRAVGVTLPYQKGLGLDELPHGSTHQNADHVPPPDLGTAVVRPPPAIPGLCRDSPAPRPTPEAIHMGVQESVPGSAQGLTIIPMGVPTAGHANFGTTLTVLMLW